MSEERRSAVEQHLTVRFIHGTIEQSESLFVLEGFEPFVEGSSDRLHLEDYYASQLIDLLPDG